MKTIYISGAISAKNREGVEKNIAVARKWAYRIWKETDWGVFCPHMNDMGAHDYGVSYEQLMAFDLTMINKCDALFMVPENWQVSRGAKVEYFHAKHYGKPVFFTIEEIKQHKKNIMRFKQAREVKFMEGEVNHSDQDFATIDYLKEAIDECLDVSNYMIGWMKNGNGPKWIRFIAGWKIRIFIRMMYWGLVMGRKLWG